MARNHVLVVDDEPLNVEILCDVLEGENFVVSSAGNGADAWQKLLDGEIPDLVVLDRMMPVMDGMEFMRRIKGDARFAGIPVIMQTAAADPAQVKEGIAAGVLYYLTKPYAPDDLMAIVRAVVADLEDRDAAAHSSERDASLVALLTQGEFGFRTLAEVELLAGTLALLCPDPARAALGLSELMVNAVEHGNLAISYDEKSHLRRNNAWESEVQRRLADPVLGRRLARIAYANEDGQPVFTISDQGEGFAWQRYLDFEPERVFDPNGRGIAMAVRSCFASVEYRGRGNLVVARIDMSPMPASE